MQFEPVPGEFFIVEIPNWDDPDYHGPFADIHAAHRWLRDGKIEDGVIIHVFPPQTYFDDRTGDDAKPLEAAAPSSAVKETVTAWRPISEAPKDREILVRDADKNVSLAEFVIMDGEELSARAP